MGYFYIILTIFERLTLLNDWLILNSLSRFFTEFQGIHLKYNKTYSFAKCQNSNQVLQPNLPSPSPLLSNFYFFCSRFFQASYVLPNINVFSDWPCDLFNVELPTMFSNRVVPLPPFFATLQVLHTPHFISDVKLPRSTLLGFQCSSSNQVYKPNLFPNFYFCYAPPSPTRLQHFFLVIFI